MSQLLVVAAAIVTVTGALAGLQWLARKVMSAVRALDAIEALVRRELQHNHGTSMKDDIHGMAVALGVTQRDVDDIKEALWRQHPDDPMFHKRERPYR